MDLPRYDIAIPKERVDEEENVVFSKGREGYWRQNMAQGERGVGLKADGRTPSNHSSTPSPFVYTPHHRESSHFSLSHLYLNVIPCR